MQVSSDDDAVVGARVECPSHRGNDGHEMQQEHLARRRVHLGARTLGADRPVVLHDEVAADRLDVDHASALIVVEDAGAVVAASARLILLVGQPEEPTLEVDISRGHLERRPCNALKDHASPLSCRAARAASVK